MKSQSIIFNKFIYPLSEFLRGIPLGKHKVCIAMSNIEVKIKDFFIILTALAYLYGIGIELGKISAQTTGMIIILSRTEI